MQSISGQPCVRYSLLLLSRVYDRNQREYFSFCEDDHNPLNNVTTVENNVSCLLHSWENMPIDLKLSSISQLSVLCFNNQLCKNRKIILLKFRILYS